MQLKLDHIALLVRDLNESAAFYTGIPGIREIANPMGGTHIRWFEFGGGQRFHMQAGDIGRTHVEKHTHFAFSADDFDTLLADLEAWRYAWSAEGRTPGAVNIRPRRHARHLPADPNGIGSSQRFARAGTRHRSLAA